MDPKCPMDQQEELREVIGEKSRLQFLHEWEGGKDTRQGLQTLFKTNLTIKEERKGGYVLKMTEVD